ncbi:MAG: Amidase [Planctomycetaceae bacterium]|nr:Amidase [Planctomycetaceae bacterium]
MPVSSELAFATIPELGRRLRAKEFSAVELATFFLDRASVIGREHNAIVTLTSELALKQAAQADRELAAGQDRGPLHGIPYGAKDLLATAGIPTSWGAAPYQEQVFDTDATVIVRLRNAGAVLIAKLAMVEIAGGFGYRQANASFTGPGLNPWDKKAWSGGSSSGPGAAVAAGVVPFAIGSETWGSIMTPAAYCGLSGLRPTYGRVSRHGAMALSWTMDKLGPMCRTAEDCGLVLHAIAGSDPADPTSAPYHYEFPPSAPLKGPFKLATLVEPSKWQPEVKENFEKSLSLLKQFATFEEVELPDLPYGEVAGTFIACEMAAAFEQLVSSGDVWELTAPEDRPGGHAAQFIPARDYINAFRIRVKIQRALDEILARFDAIVTPTMPAVAVPNDTDFRKYFAPHSGSKIGGAGNAAGIPAISIPNGFGERGLPTGVQFVGRAFEENKLLAIAQKYQSVTKWHLETPKS